MGSEGGGAGEVLLDANVRDLRNELNRLNNLIKSVLHKTYRDDLEFVWVQNSLLLGLSLIVKSSRCFVLPTHEVSKTTGLEKDFRTILRYINARVESDTNDLNSPVHILEKLVHYIIAPHIPCSLKISMSHVVLLCCFHFFLSGRHELALKMSTWFSQNSDAVFPEKSLQFSLDPDLEVLPLLFSDVTCWKRTCCDVICLFKILLSSCFLVKNDYSFVANLHTDDIPNANNELLLIVFYLKAVALFKIRNYDESVELLQKSLVLDPHMLMLVNIFLLLSLNFSQQDKHHLSIQMLKHCLKTYPSCQIAVLFLSHQYRLLNLQVAEIQSLDLLQEIIGKCHGSEAVPSTLIYNFISHLLLSNIGITSSQVLLHLSLCHLELQKYEMAIDNFERMITLSPELFSGTIFSDDLKCCSRYVGVIDTCRKIVLALLNASKFSDSIEFCEKVTKSMSSKQINGDDGEFSHEMFMYKAQGYCGLQKYNEALSTISCVVIQLENSCIHDVRFQGKKIDTVNHSESTLQLKEKDQYFNLLCEAYGLKSKILTKLENFQEAVHYSRLAYQISPDDLSKALDLSVALANAGREVESALMWLRSRKFTILVIDEIQIRTLIEKRIGDLKITCAEEKRFLDRDIESLKILLQQKNVPLAH